MKLVFTREMHAGYLTALNELDQREEYTYLCPKDELPKGFVNLIDQVPTQFCILTTRLIYQNIRTLLMERGLNMKLVPMFIITEISLELEKSLPIWQYCFKPDALYDVAIEKLLAMIRGEETVVFEESPPEFIEPSQHIDPLTFAD